MRALWNKGPLGKAVVGVIGLLVLCCVVGALRGPRTTNQSVIPTEVQEAEQPTNEPAMAVNPPTEKPAPTEAPPAPTEEEPPTATPVAPTEASTVEPSLGLGMSRAVWEAKAGASTGKGLMGDVYSNGIEATFIDDKLWRIDYAFQEGNYPTPDEAHDVGKMFVPNDAVLMETYQRDVTTVNLYRSDWLASRFEVDSFTGGEPGNFTLQYNVYEGEVHSLIIGLGNNP